MADERDRQLNQDDVKSDKGRKDEVGTDAPADAAVRTSGNLVNHAPRKPGTDEHPPKSDQSSGSE